MVGPRSGEHEDNRGAGERTAVEERDGIGEMGVVDFGERGGAVVEGILDGGDEFFFGVGFGELGGFRSGYAGNFGTEKIIGFRDMKSEMSEAHLAWRGLEAEFIAGTLFSATRHSSACGAEPCGGGGASL